MTVEGFQERAAVVDPRVHDEFLIVMGAPVFGYSLTISRAPDQLLQWSGGSGLENWQILSMILLITLSLTFPVVSKLGYDPIWFGVVVVKLVDSRPDALAEISRLMVR